MDKLVQSGRRFCIAFHHLNADCCLLRIISCQTIEQLSFHFSSLPSLSWLSISLSLSFFACHYRSPHVCIYHSHSSSFFLYLLLSAFVLFLTRVFLEIKTLRASWLAIQISVMKGHGCWMEVGSGSLMDSEIIWKYLMFSSSKWFS